MARFGASEQYDPQVRGSTFKTIFLKIFGTVETSSSHLHFKKNMKKIKKEIQCQHILDAGCGRGKYSFWLAERIPDAIIDACDLSKKKIEICKETQGQLKIENINFFEQDLITFNDEEMYDLVYSNHVLEHIPENLTVISQLVKGLRTGGYLYIQIPNATQKRLFFGKRYLNKFEEWEKKEHVGQTLTLDRLISELERLGCDILVQKYTEGFWGELRFELEEMALRHFNSQALFVLLFPFLKLFGLIDSLKDHSDGNGILVLARKRN